jgi:2-dehydro-3-deoxygluconokinase
LEPNDVDVVTYGEAMIRLSPPNFRRLEQTQNLDITVGGAELNVAVDVSRLGLRSAWVSCLPENALGRMTRNKAREQGVNTDWVRWDNEGRMGLYFVEYGSSPRASSVLYDRGASSINRTAVPAFNWDEIFVGARVFHTTGITVALSDHTAEEARIAMAAARQCGLLVTYDLNYRARLWTEDRARAVQEPMMSCVDVLFTTEEDTRRVFGIEGTDYREVARCLSERYSIPTVVVTLRGDLSVLRNEWTSIAYSQGQIFDDRSYEIEIVDRIGGGDAYAAGFIFGLLADGTAHAVRFGNALSALKQTMWSDFCWVSRQEVEALLSGSGSRIVR